MLNSQELMGDELEMFAKKEAQKDVVVPKKTGEPLGVVVVESGWGSMLPTVVIANLQPNGAASRCNQLNIGDQVFLGDLCEMDIFTFRQPHCKKLQNTESTFRTQLISGCGPVDNLC